MNREGRPPATRQQFRQRRWLITAGLIVFLAAIIFARRGATFSAPSETAPGATITVRADDLRSGGAYALTLYTRHASAGTTFCQGQIARPQDATAVSFTVRLPQRLPCYGSTSTRSTGSITVAAGRYALVVAQRDGIGFAARYSLLTRRLRIT